MSHQPDGPARLRAAEPASGEDVLLRPEQAAELCGVTRRQLARLGAPFVDLGPRNRRYSLRDLRAWLQERRRSPAEVENGKFSR